MIIQKLSVGKKTYQIQLIKLAKNRNLSVITDKKELIKCINLVKQA